MSRRGRRQGRNDELLQGVLLVDKPAGLTSREVCERVRTLLRLGKVGHGGTLDPFATGLLPLLLNGATRLMPYLQDQDKLYRAVVRLGVRTDTMDPTGAVTATADASGVTESAVREVLARFVGSQQQTVPRFAAARVDGKRLYEYARDGEDVELPVKEIRIDSIDLRAVRPEGTVVDLEMDIHCGPGTYVRALADDVGQALGVGAHLYQLHRLANGGLSVHGALALSAIEEQAELWHAERLAVQERQESRIPFVPVDNARRWSAFLGKALVPVSLLLGGLPTALLVPDLVARVQSGQPLRRGEIERMEGQLPSFKKGERVVLMDPTGLSGIAIALALCSRESFARRDPSAVVLQVERVLR